MAATQKPVNHRDYITVDPDKRFGKPCIRNMRITVFDVIRFLASGMSHEEILDDFPELTHEDILACYSYLADEAMVPRKPHDP